jgi:hypothetical protein
MMKKRPEGRHSRAGQLRFDYRRWRCHCNEAEAAHWLDQHADEALRDGDPVVISLLPEVVDHYLRSARLEPVR